MSDWRNLPPVDCRPERPERLSQSLLARGDECLRAAYLDLTLNGGSSSHAMDRGSAIHLVSQRMLHDLIDREEQTLYAAQPGEDPVLAKRHAASLTAAIVDEVARDHPELSLRAADWDQVRLMSYHLAVGALVQPERVCAIERKFLLAVGGAVISGRMDTVELDGDTAIITDVKSTLALPDQETFESRFQGRLYAVLFCFGSPVEKVPDENGEVVEVERPPLGRHVNRVIVREAYPRYLRDDGLIQHREHTMTRTEVQDFRVDVERLVARFDHAFESGKWQAVPGSHCFGGETRFITDRGVRSLAEACGERVRVLNRFGEWEDAEVCSFGVQPLLRVEFDDGSAVRATADHRWFPADGNDHDGYNWQSDERVTTVELDRAPLVRYAELPGVDAEGVRHGFVFGDGWRRDDRGTCNVRFTAKDEELIPYFEGVPAVGGAPRRGTGINRRGDGYLYMTALPGHYKSFPESPTPEYARGFTAGLIAADGHVDTYGGVTISCEGAEKAERIAELARLGGAVVQSVLVSHSGATNFSRTPTTTRELMGIRLKPASAPVITRRQQARLNGRNQMRQMYRQVVRLEEAGREEVFCVVAPGSESFTLASGIVTSNCQRCPAWTECPLPEALRGEAPIESDEDAEDAAVRWLMRDREAKAEKKRLREWASEHGSITLGRDYVLEFRTQPNPNSSTGISTRFDRFKVKPGEQEVAEG